MFHWVNTALGNLKTSHSGAYHAFGFNKYAERYLALPFTHKPQQDNKESSVVYQGVADAHVLHGSIALPQ